MKNLFWRLVKCNHISACLSMRSRKLNEKKKKEYKFYYNKLLAVTVVLPTLLWHNLSSPFIPPQTLISTVNVPSQQSQPRVAVGGHGQLLRGTLGNMGNISWWTDWPKPPGTWPFTHPANCRPICITVSLLMSTRYLFKIHQSPLNMKKIFI